MNVRSKNNAETLVIDSGVTISSVGRIQLVTGMIRISRVFRLNVVHIVYSPVANPFNRLMVFDIILEEDENSIRESEDLRITNQEA